MTITSILVTGASDDLIEVAGEDLTEEFPYEDTEEGDLLAFSDGTILRIEFSSTGVWRIKPIVRGAAKLTIEQAPEDDEDDDTDRATLEGDIRWVVHGLRYARSAR